jgi:hypothetical protein
MTSYATRPGPTWTRPVYLDSSLQDLQEGTNMIQLGLHLTQINSQGTPRSTTPELLLHPLTPQGLSRPFLGHLVMPCQAPVTLSPTAFTTC